MSFKSGPLSLGAATLLTLGLAGCDESATPPTSAPVLDRSASAVATDPGVELVAMMDNINLALEASGANYRAAIAEYVTDAAGSDAGGTVLSKVVGNKQLTADFIPNDPNRAGWSGAAGGGSDDITYAVDQTGDAVPLGGGLSAAQTDAAIDRAMATWNAVSCTDLPLTRNPDFGLDLGLIAFLNGLGASPFVVADVQHAGFRDINFAGGVLGATFTFIFTSGGVPTDLDGNGKLDTAFREIYYDPSWIWADDGVSNIDVESVALHEAGHGLSQAHFGKVWLKNDGSLAASPRAVMNALYAGPFRALAGTDNGGHCSNWAGWPNN
jgi:hypothetical protein